LPPLAELLHVRLPHGLSAPRQARQALERVDELEPLLDDVLLVASELTTNAVQHSGAPPGSEIALRAQLSADAILIEVTDEGQSRSTPHMRPMNTSVPGGFGLPVVAALARRWGSERRNGMRVWAELPL
jgi:anti-sigma regulatory factor (Ser/Thr protein kinase)